MKMKIKLDKGAVFPTRAHEYDAGLDLYAPFDCTVSRCISGLDGGAMVGYGTIDTGVHVQIPEGHVGMIKSKSGLNVKHGLTAEGVIDSGYTGSIVVKLYNHSCKETVFEAGDKIAQLVIMPIDLPELELVDDLEQTERGAGGFGSTGR